MMKVKKIISLIEFLAMTGLVSVGFSSWSIVGTTMSAGGQIEAEEYISKDNYSEMMYMNLSEYNQYGFINNGDINEVSLTGYLSVKVEVYLDEIKKDGLFDPTNIGLSFTLSEKLSDFPLLAAPTIKRSSYSYQYDFDDKITNSTIIDMSNNVQIEVLSRSIKDYISFTNIDEDYSLITLYINYAFTFDETTYSYFYNARLNNQSMEFSLLTLINMEDI